MEKVKKTPKHHKPVLVEEVLSVLGLKNAHLNSKAQMTGLQKVVVDATVGLGGHSTRIVESKCHLIGIDADKNSLEYAENRLKEACPPLLLRKKGCFELIHGNFKDINILVREAGYEKVDGIIFDLGVSTDQLTNSIRGFSFQNEDAPLDMRIDNKRQAVTAANLLNALRKDQLVEMFSTVVRKGDSSRLASSVIKARVEKPFTNVGDFIEVVNKVFKGRNGKLNAATLPFLALRIAVNSELENIKIALPDAFSLLNKGGKLVVITFHSGEDSIIKNYFKLITADGLAKYITKKPILPKESEVKSNPSARSAKLRAIEKI